MNGTDANRLATLITLRSRLRLELTGTHFDNPTAPTVRAILRTKTRDKERLLQELNAHIKENWNR